ncbi:calmodulin-like [Drosophila takahashii]|uniref:calmodulin-like n=1 Tax=Drosophila takahashii TaxID=29030 RepID=UPI001CF92EE3|nr:neo-calmodulin-like [Drosophila takahashii]
MDEISGPRLSNYKHSYSQLNRNERGVITIKELGAMIRSLGENPTERELEDILKTSDVDGNGEIDFKDYCFVMARFENQEEREMCQLFKMFDRDCDGLITESELIQLIQITDFQADKKIIMHMLRERHSNGDGLISFTEFRDMIRRTFG